MNVLHLIIQVAVVKYIIAISVLHLIIQVGVVKYYCYHECITLNYTGSCS